MTVKIANSASDSEQENMACAKRGDEVEQECCKDDDDQEGFYTPSSSPDNVSD